MMKQFICVLIFLCLAAAAFADAFSLTEYPPVINNGAVLINAGIGYGKTELSDIKCPPLTASLDFAVPVIGLPFTLGLGTGYSAEKGDGKTVKNMPIGLRIAYHIGIDVTRLDTYLLVQGGGIIHWFEDKVKGSPWIWGGIGGRYYFKPAVGAYMELGFGKVYNISAGIAFRL